jgi:hypothetical protein
LAAYDILDESKRQEQQFNEQMQSNNEESDSADSAAQLGRDMATFGLVETIDQLFARNFAFFVHDAMMEMRKENHNLEIKMEEPVKNNMET